MAKRQMLSDDDLDKVSGGVCTSGEDDFISSEDEELLDHEYTYHSVTYNNVTVQGDDGTELYGPDTNIIPKELIKGISE